LKFGSDVQNLFRRADFNLMDREELKEFIERIINFNFTTNWCECHKLLCVISFKMANKLFKNAIYSQLFYCQLRE
jgi:hypothetical protein